MAAYRVIHRGFSYEERSSRRVYILDCTMAYDLLIINSFFKKNDDHLVTFKSGSTRTQIDFFLMRAHNRREDKDCKVTASECLIMQHRLLVLAVRIKSLKRKRRRVADCKVRWWNLTGGEYE